MNAALKTYQNEDGRIMVEHKPGQYVSLGIALERGLISRKEHVAILNDSADKVAAQSSSILSARRVPR